MIFLSFLGSGAGVAPLLSRACSASLLHIGGQTCLIDCAEGTHRQFLSLHSRIRGRNGLDLGRVSPGLKAPLPLLNLWSLKHIFITHMHLDHCMGLPTLLTYLLCNTTALTGPLEVFGPPGIRLFIRSVLTQTSTSTWTNARYRVNELLTSSDAVTSCEEEDLHSSELVGQDIFCGADGLWRQLHSTSAFDVSAGPIVHRIPCLGYVFTSHIPSAARKNAPRYSHTPKKIVYLGDTSDPSAIAPLAQGASLLVHEATLLDTVLPRPTAKSKSKPGIIAPEGGNLASDAGKSEGPAGHDIATAASSGPILPQSASQTANSSASLQLNSDAISSPDPSADNSLPDPDSMRAKAVAMGHSTASMAGAFARRIDAHALALNHFSHRYRPWDNFAAAEFERRAMLAWNGEDDPRPLPQKTSEGVGIIAGGTAASLKFSTEDGPARWIQL